MCRWSIFAIRAHCDNSEQLKEKLEMGQEAGKHAYFHQLNGKKLLLVFNSTISEKNKEILRWRTRLPAHWLSETIIVQLTNFKFCLV
jgi:hypothetical protein